MPRIGKRRVIGPFTKGVRGNQKIDGLKDSIRPIIGSRHNNNNNHNKHNNNLSRQEQGRTESNSKVNPPPEFPNKSGISLHPSKECHGRKVMKNLRIVRIKE